MNYREKRYTRLLFLSGLFVTGLAWHPAWANVGEAIFVRGEVQLTRNVVRPLQKGDFLEVRDSITTGTTGRTQLLMIDNSRIALRPDTVFVVERLQVTAGAKVSTSGPSVVASPADDGVLYRLLKGGLRTMTGDIDGDNYQLDTPVATLGIRGTAYSVALADPSECIKSGGRASASKVALYVTVSKGSVYIENDAGRLNLDTNEFGCVTGLDQAPLLQLKPSAVLAAESRALGGDDGTKGGGGIAGPPLRPPPGPPHLTPDDDDSDPTWPPIVFMPPVDEPCNTRGQPCFGANQSAAVAVPPPAGAPGTFQSRARPPSGSVTRDNAGNLTALSFADGASYALGTANNINAGSDADSGIRWGRWAGGVATENDNPLDLSNSSLHWVVGPAGSGDPVVPNTGSREYVLTGNTDPTDNQGNVGVLSSATFNANFDNSSVSSMVNISIADRQWNSGVGDGVLNGGGFNGTYSGVEVIDTQGNGSDMGTGQFSGLLTDEAAAAGLTYSLNADGVTVSGAAVFGPPTVGQ